MKIQCKSCNAVYNIDESKIPENGVNISCKKCQNRMYIEKAKKDEQDEAKEHFKEKIINYERIESLLERIAVALEKISESCERKEDKQIIDEKDETQETVETTSDDEIKNVEAIESFLNSKSIQIKHLPDEDPADDVINSFAAYMGDKYDNIEKIYKIIKRTMQKGDSFTYHVANESQTAISSMCQFCHRLHETAFLAEYKYFKSPKYLIKGRSSTLPKVQNFFSGQWLERYIMLKIKETINLASNQISIKLSSSYMINPQIILPNGDDFELDIIYEINGMFYWVEAKTGDYQSYADKYSRISKILGLDSSHSFMVLTDIKKSVCESLSSIFSMNVCSIDTFFPTILNLLINDHGEVED